MSRDQDNGRREADLAIKKVLEEHGEVANASTVWRVQGTAVISHKALERIAGRVGIRFDMPTILRAERDEAVMLVAGTRGEMREWSVGECVINQNYRVSGRQAAYPWAMAEKRAKDRVILKLLALHGLAYSEEEADDFRGRADADERPEPRRPAEDAGAPNEIVQHERAVAGAAAEDGGRAEFIASCLATIRNKADGKDLRDWWQSTDHKKAIRDFGLDQDEIDALKDAVQTRLSEIGRAPEANAPRRMNGNGHTAGQREGARA